MKLKIFQLYSFGRLVDGEIEYFKPYKGGLKVEYVTASGMHIVRVITNPSEADMNSAGWYQIVIIDEQGEDFIQDNILYHYSVTDE